MKNILDYIEQMKDMYEGPRITAQEPRNMDQAALVDELEPGALKDEMLGKFNPDQETYEEYLRRINLERPFNMNQGGRIGFYKGREVKQGKRQGQWAIDNVPESVSKTRTIFFPDEKSMNKWIESRPGKGAFDIGERSKSPKWKRPTKGKILPINQEKLNKLIKIVNESNNSYKKTITSKDALIKAGWKDGYQSIGSTQAIRPAVVKELSKLNTTYEKIDNYVNNVMLAEDALMKDFRNPIRHIQKKFGVSTGVTDKWTSPKHYGSQVYKNNKALFNGLGRELSFNKYVNYADGTPRLMSDYSVITQNKMPSSTGWFSGDDATKFIGDTAKRNYLQMKAAGKTPKVRFITDPSLTNPRDWQFIDNETGRLFSMDPSIDTVEFQGKTYKNNYLQHKDARKLYKKEFGNLYKLFDEDLAKYMDAMVIGKDGKQIKLDTVLRQQAFDATGKEDFLKRRFMEADHADLWNDPFGRKTGGLRLIDRRANQQAGLYKRLEKYKNNPKLLNQKLDEIGYNRKFNNTDELIKFYSDTATNQRITAKNFLKNIPKGEAGFIERELLEDFAKAGKKGARVASKYGIIPEFIFGVTDYLNEKSKGKSTEEARGIALNNLTFGAYDDPKNIAYMKGLKKTAESMGIDARAFDDIYNLNVAGQKFDKYYVKAKEEIENLKELGYDKKADDAQKNLDRYMKEQNENLDNLSQKVIDQVSISKAGGAASPLQLSKARDVITQEDYYKPFKDITKVAKEKLKREKRKAFPTQKFHVDTAAGEWGEGFYKAFDALTQGAKNVLQGRIIPYGPERLRPLESERQKEARYLKEMEPRELYLRNKARGYTYDQPITEADIMDLRYNQPGVFFSTGGRASHMGGGIAGIRRPNAIPPKRQGLRSIMINVNDD